MKTTFVTGNINKVREVEKILGTPIDHVDIDLDEIQGLDPKAISTHKVLEAWKQVGKPLFVIDQSIYIHCLNDFPGPLIKWFWEQVTLKKICEIANAFDDHLIRAETVVTYYDGKEVKHFSGEVVGTIPPEPRGNKGWGWDPIFIPEDSELTYAEIDPEDVLDLRAHKIALKKLDEYLSREK